MLSSTLASGVRGDSARRLVGITDVTVNSGGRDTGVGGAAGGREIGPREGVEEGVAAEELVRGRA